MAKTPRPFDLAVLSALEGCQPATDVRIMRDVYHSGFSVSRRLVLNSLRRSLASGLVSVTHTSGFHRSAGTNGVFKRHEKFELFTLTVAGLCALQASPEHRLVKRAPIDSSDGAFKMTYRYTVVNNTKEVWNKDDLLIWENSSVPNEPKRLTSLSAVRAQTPGCLQAGAETNAPPIDAEADWTSRLGSPTPETIPEFRSGTEVAISESRPFAALPEHPLASFMRDGPRQYYRPPVSDDSVDNETNGDSEESK